MSEQSEQPEKEYTAKEAQNVLGLSDKPFRRLAASLEPPVVPHTHGEDLRYHWFYAHDLARMAEGRKMRIPRQFPRPTLFVLAEQLYDVQQAVTRLEQGQQQMQRSIAELQAQRGLPPSQRGKPRQIAAPETRPAPGQVVLAEFAKLHGLEPGRSYQAMPNLKPPGVRALLDQSQRTAWYRQYRDRPGFTRCADCPVREGDPHG